MEREEVEQIEREGETIRENEKKNVRSTDMQNNVAMCSIHKFLLLVWVLECVGKLSAHIYN